MIIHRTIEVHGKHLAYEVVLQGDLVTTGEVAQYTIVVHDPDLSGGRRRGALLPQGMELPNNHVIVGQLAVK